MRFIKAKASVVVLSLFLLVGGGQSVWAQGVEPPQDGEPAAVGPSAGHGEASDPARSVLPAPADHSIQDTRRGAPVEGASKPGAAATPTPNAATGSGNKPAGRPALNLGGFTGAKTYDSFSEVRTDLLNAIGGASKRVWISTSYLTDGELVSSLYVAQYRKVDVEVLLGRAKANFYMSRLNYLKNQNIPVFLRPETRSGPATQMLCDDQLYLLDGEMDFMSRYKHFTLTKADAAAAAAFAKTFAEDINKKVPAIPTPMPMVGHINPNTATMRNGAFGGGRTPRLNPRYDRQDGSGAYTYGGRSPPRPEDIPAKLPKVLKYEQQPKQPLPVLKDDTEQD